MKVFNAAAAGHVHPIKVGDAFKIELQGNATTGYSWQPLGWSFNRENSSLQGPESPFKLTGNGYDQARIASDGVYQKVGCGGLFWFTFTAVIEGLADITMEYKRPWLEEVEEVVNYHFRVSM